MRDEKPGLRGAKPGPTPARKGWGSIGVNGHIEGGYGPIGGEARIGGWGESIIDGKGT